MRVIYNLAIVSFLFAASIAAGEDGRGKTYDYIIVGGGTSGLVVANRLSENKKSEQSPDPRLSYSSHSLDTRLRTCYRTRRL